MKDSDLEKQTRKIFHDIHLAHLADEEVTTRHSDIIEPGRLGFPEDYFEGTVCADLGCGSAAHGVVNLLNLGAQFVHALDIDSSFIKPASERLESNESYVGRWQADIGSILDLPYEEEQFDFVLCRGVIHHVSDDNKAVAEIHRVLKTGGKAFIYVTGKGGMLNRLFKEVLRDEYQHDEAMQQLVVDGDLEGWLKDQLEDLKNKIDSSDQESWQASVNLLENLMNLIDNDLVLSLRDIVQAPQYMSYTEAQWFTLLEDNGFKRYHRVFYKPHYRNVRTIFAPLYYEHDHPLARLFYGDGSMNVVVTK